MMGYKEEKELLDRKKLCSEEAWEAYSKIEKKWKRKIDNSQKKVDKKGCQHHFYNERTQLNDDGYGRWNNLTFKTCKICGKETVYQNWPLGDT